MVRLRGIGAESGIGHGPARRLLPWAALDQQRLGEGQVAAEVNRFDAAVATADAAMVGVGNEQRAHPTFAQDMVDVHRAILSSPELTEEPRRLIREREIGAEWAVQLVVEEMRKAFGGLSDEHFRARFEDVEAVATRLLRALTGDANLIDEQFRGCIAIGWELSPLDALELHRMGVAGFATEHGGPTSHSTIIARTLGIPYVFGVPGLVAAVSPPETVWVDARSGEVIASPDRQTAEALAVRYAAEEERVKAVRATRHAPAVTLEGVAVSVEANVESAEEVVAAVAAGADHIGLVRTELLYLAAPRLPTEEEQYYDAVAILRAAQGRTVTFRTLDIGDDKLPAALRVPAARNPALGMRGIRLSLRSPMLFSTQLRALYRAAATGPMRLMLPMVSTVEEVRQARVACAAVCRQLAQEGVAHDSAVPLGAMIETPSAALTADHILGECDFLSIGTNDLIQFVFAADRQSEEVAFLYQPLHPAVLRSLESIFAAARRAQRPVTVCGDMAGDPLFTPVLLGLGLRSFSMPGRSVGFVKSAIRATTLTSATRLAEQALRCTTHAEVVALIGDRGAMRASK